MQPKPQPPHLPLGVPGQTIKQQAKQYKKWCAQVIKWGRIKKKEGFSMG